MSKQSQKRRQRKRLWEEQRGLCWWCKCAMTWPIQVPGRGIKHPPTEATLDHLDSRLDPNRGAFKGQERHVLACRACNERRGLVEQATLPSGELWRRSGRYPIGVAERSY